MECLLRADIHLVKVGSLLHKTWNKTYPPNLGDVVRCDHAPVRKQAQESAEVTTSLLREVKRSLLQSLAENRHESGTKLSFAIDHKHPSYRQGCTHFLGKFNSMVMKAIFSSGNESLLKKFATTFRHKFSASFCEVVAGLILFVSSLELTTVFWSVGFCSNMFCMNTSE